MKCGVKQSCRNRNAECIIKECPEKVLADVANCSFTQSHCVTDSCQGIRHKNNVCCLHCNISTGPDGHTDIRSRQSGCIIDAIANHKNTMAFLAQFFDRTCLFSRQHIRNHLFDSGRCCDGLGRILVISRQHYNMKPFLFHRRNSKCGILFQHISGDDCTQENMIFRSKIQDRLSLFGIP